MPPNFVAGVKYQIQSANFGVSLEKVLSASNQGGAEHRIWDIKPEGNGKYTIMNGLDGRYLSVERRGIGGAFVPVLSAIAPPWAPQWEINGNSNIYTLLVEIEVGKDGRRTTFALTLKDNHAALEWQTAKQAGASSNQSWRISSTPERQATAGTEPQNFFNNISREPGPSSGANGAPTQGRAGGLKPEDLFNQIFGGSNPSGTGASSANPQQIFREMFEEEWRPSGARARAPGPAQGQTTGGPRSETHYDKPYGEQPPAGFNAADPQELFNQLFGHGRAFRG